MQAIVRKPSKPQSKHERGAVVFAAESCMLLRLYVYCRYLCGPLLLSRGSLHDKQGMYMCR